MRESARDLLNEFVANVDSATTLISDPVAKEWLHRVRNLLDATPSIPAQQTPEGWQLVQVELTTEQLIILDCAGEKANWPSGYFWRDIWRKLLSASLSPPLASTGEGEKG